jgi:hypothetical protein
MTFSLTAGDVRDIVEVATIVGSIVAVLVSALVIYFVVRPSRRQRSAEPADALDREEMLALMDRMERRLAMLERLVTQDAGPARIAPQGEHEISKAVEDREPGRTK